jgi:hypothetical protein
MIAEKTREVRGALAFGTMRFLTPNLHATVKEQLSYINHTPRPFTRFLKRRFGNQPVSGLEVGFGFGDNAVSLLEELNVQALYCVDPFQPYHCVLSTVADYSEDKKGYRQILSHDERVHFIKARSDEAFTLRMVPDKLDFVYVDGLHTTAQAHRDIINALRRSKLVGGHDFTRSFESTVVPAVFKVSAETGLIPTVEMPDFWFETKSQ